MIIPISGIVRLLVFFCNMFEHYCNLNSSHVCLRFSINMLEHVSVHFSNGQKQVLGSDCYVVGSGPNHITGGHGISYKAVLQQASHQ